MFDVRCLRFEARRGIRIAALAGFFATGSLFAESPSVTAVLSKSEVVIGETVELQIRVTGSGAKPPGEIAIDGLEIHQTGTEQHYEMNNFNVSQSVIYNYTVLPMKIGKFNIPPQTIQAGGSTLRTPGLVLNVTDSGGRFAQSGRNAVTPSTVDPKKFGFIELIVPKNQAYVGEMIPVVVKLCLNPRVRFRQIAPLEIQAQGLTVQKLQKSDENMETINGATYEVTTFKTALAAAKTGKFEIPPLQTKAIALVQRRREPSTMAPRSRSPLDLFDDPLFGDPFSQLLEPREINLTSEPVTLEVKSLPPNAPANFSGAVGNFTMTADANPKSVQVSDPITVTSTISGRGNFDRVNAPAIDDERGWHKYPPSAKFKQDDDVGISGTKTFDLVLSPNEKKQAVPALAFSFFDPAKEKYVALRSEPIPIRVEGNALPSASAAASPQVSALPAAAVTPKLPAKPQDILYQLNDFGRAQTFTPLYMRPVFWMTQLVALLALIGFAGWKLRQIKIDNREAQRIAALQHEAADLMRKLRRNDGSPQEYFSQASRAVQVKTALVSRSRGIDPNIVDLEVATKTFRLDESSREQLRKLFARSDELRYSGATNGAETISAQDRDEVLDLIESLRA
jgi:hypothetical protein